MMLREEPRYHLAHMLLSHLMDIDALLTKWRCECSLSLCVCVWLSVCE